ncbi:MAG: hypothetical protein DCF15_18745 [Phormidesmis priestleyi]|uniref:Uncharacterized protein n=1 Tax=Phormidesmis priestleyi TaxID=268141 RepID=A0A2W4WT39_9CYAN|nr:MAG: hypothetical protein DCF15_18745 [Phormidesmis priestleyi]
MKYWEFLIQKEGDQTWLPLEAQQVEILEGRYRVVAHTDRVETPMDIRVSQLITDELPTRKRIRKRTGKTNGTGLVVVMPYMHLKPGEWELICSGLDNLDALTGESWQYHVQLHVFARTEEDWSSEWPIPTDSETVDSVLIEDSSARDLSHATREDLPLLQAQAELETQRQNKNSYADSSASETTFRLEPAAQAYRISLRQQAYLARHNQPMTIVGKVNSLTEALNEDTSELWIRLQNPQTAQIIMEAHRPLSLARLPADFKVQIQLPAEISTRVILGEVSLKATASETHTPTPILASTAFTITAGIAQLLDTIANQDASVFEEETAVLLESKAPTHKAADPMLPLTSLDLTPQGVAPAVGVVLPPQLSRDNDTTAASAAHYLDLPTFGASAEANGVGAIAPESTDNANPASSPTPPPTLPLSYPPMVSQPAQFLGTSILEDDLETDEIAAALEDIDENLHLANSALDELEPPGIEAALSKTDSQNKHPSAQQTAQQADWLKDNQSEPADSAESSDHDFQSLKLKDHFWQRLTNLTHEGRQEANQLAQNMKAAGVSQSRTANQPELSDFTDGNEIVVYDEPAAPQWTQRNVQRDPQRPGSARDQAIEQRRAQRLASLQANRQAKSGQSRLDQSRLDPSASQESTSHPLTSRFEPPIQAAAAAQADLPEMALPVISVPMGDLVAGELVTITVRTRPSAFKPFIKLWMVDRQSRSLVIEPKLLTNLKPDALGDLEAATQMLVPMDCLDVQIAAIAIDMATQQESSKAVVNRHVIPASQISSFQRFNL